MSAQQQPDLRNWKLIHDPMLRKGLPKLIRYNGVASDNIAYNVVSVSDPRSLTSRLFSRSEPVDLPVPTFAIDENYVGQPALRELAFFDLNDNVSESFLTDMCKKFGQLEEVKVFTHPTTKRRLGVARVVFRSQKEATACLEKYNGASVMGSTLRVIADPWGKKVKEAVDQLTNKNQTSSSHDHSISKVRGEDAAPSAAATQVQTKQSSLENLARNFHPSQRTPANAMSSSPAIPQPPATPGTNGAVPDDPSSQSYAGVPPYGLPPYPPPPVYQMPPWPTTHLPPAPPPQWVAGMAPWVQPPPWPMPVPPNCIPPPIAQPSQGEIAVPPVAESKEEKKERSRRRSHSGDNGKERKTHSRSRSKAKEGDRNKSSRSASRLDRKSSSRPTSRTDRKSSSRPSSRLEDRSHHDRHRRSGSRSKSGRRRSTISPDSHHHRQSSGRDDHRSHYRYDKERGPSPLAYDRHRKRAFDGRETNHSKRHRSKSRGNDGVHSRSPKRSRKSRQRSSGSIASSSDAKAEPMVESVDEEEEYYRRSKTSSQHRTRRSDSRASTGEAKKDAVIGKAALESRKSGGSEYCDEIEEYEYYRRKRRQRRVVSSSSKHHQNSSKSSGAEHQLEQKFEAITSSDDDGGSRKKSAEHRRQTPTKKTRGHASSAADHFKSEISPPFGQLERISCSSGDDSDADVKKSKKKHSEMPASYRSLSKNANDHGCRSRRAKSHSSSDSRSSSFERSDEKRRRRYQKKRGDRQRPTPTRIVEEKAVVCKKSLVKKEKTTKDPPPACEVPGSLESRIQQLLGVEQSRNQDENCSTPLQDEPSISGEAGGERTSDVEMSLSSGEEDQSTPINRVSTAAKEPAPTPVRPVTYGNTGVLPPGYYPSQGHMYMYPPMGTNYMAHMPPMIPPPNYALWPPPSQPYAPMLVPAPSIPYTSTQAPPPVSNLPREKSKSSGSKPVSVEQIRRRTAGGAVSQVKVALKAVLYKDIIKRIVETPAFQAVDSWYARKETEYKTNAKESDGVATASMLSFSQTLSLSNLFDSRPTSGELGSSLTGVPGLGLRASLPKLPSFKRKIVRPSTPPSPSLSRRRGRSQSSERASSVSSRSSSSSSSSSESEDDEEKSEIEEEKSEADDRSEASGDEVASRGRKKNRSRAVSSSSSSGRSRSASVETEIQAATAKTTISSDEEEEDERRKPEERPMEPISEEEIEDEPVPNTVEDESMPSEDDTAKNQPMVETESEKEAEEISVKIGHRLESDKEEDEKDEKEQARPLVDENTISPTKAGRGRRRRGRPRRIETTTEEECSGQENVDVDIDIKESARALPEIESVEPQKPVAEYPEGVMFVDEGALYVPNEFDHHYTLRLGQTPPAPSTPTVPSAVLKPKQPIVVPEASPKVKASSRIMKPPKPARPAITFKPRMDTEEFQIFFDFLQSGIDEEDIGYFKMIYDQFKTVSPTLRWAPHAATAEPPFKKRRLQPDEIPAHSTGCARTQGLYRLSRKEKRITKPRQAMDYTDAQSQQNLIMAKQQVQLSREARSMQRRLLATLGSEVDSDLLKYNQLKFRKKQIKFSRSRIHGWGLFAMEDIAQDEMIVEYVGEKIRITVAEKREKKYEKMGVGSSYLFRIDNEMVVDATKRGNIARFINHSCNPNCYARIITVEGEKRIVIYSKQNISLGEEITYDYKFPLEDEKIPCYCGASCCRGTLN